MFRGLILSEFGEDCLEGAFFRSNDLSGIRIADPFMGGGTPLIEANRLGCAVQGFDINPMSAWVVREEIEHLDVAAYERTAAALIASLRTEIGEYYRTSCPRYGDADVPVEVLFVGQAARLRSLRDALRSLPGLPSRRE